jgi:hypothetical protein
MASKILLLALAATLALSGFAHSQQVRQPRIEGLMTPTARALIVTALREVNVNSPLAKAYSQGAPLTWTHVAEIEKALQALGTTDATALVTQIEDMRAPVPAEPAAPAQPTTPPKPLTFNDGYNVGWAEQHGPQFELALSRAKNNPSTLLPDLSEVATVRRALDKLSDMHDRYADGIDDYMMGRRSRVLENLNHRGTMLFGMYADIDLVDADGNPWQVQHFTLPEIILTGYAVSNDRYREAPMEEPEQPTLVARIVNYFSMAAFAQEMIPPKMVARLDGLAENVDCYLENVAAMKLFDRIAEMRHSYPGGNP